MKITNKELAKLSIEQQRRYLMFKALCKLESAKANVIEQMYLSSVSQPMDFAAATLRDLILYENNTDTDDEEYGEEAFSEWLEDTKDDIQDFLDH